MDTSLASAHPAAAGPVVGMRKEVLHRPRSYYLNASTGIAIFLYRLFLSRTMDHIQNLECTNRQISSSGERDTTLGNMIVLLERTRFFLVIEPRTEPSNLISVTGITRSDTLKKPSSYVGWASQLSFSSALPPDGPP